MTRRAHPKEIRDKALELAIQYDAVRPAADELGLPHRTVYKWAEQEGIKLMNNPKKRRTIDIARKKLRKAKDIAKICGVSVSSVRKWCKEEGVEYVKVAHFIEWEKYDPIIGTMPDTEVAKIIGCTCAPVSARRRELGLEPYVNPDKVSKEFVNYWRGVGEFQKLLSWPRSKQLSEHIRELQWQRFTTSF
jgi:transposase-like protein